jgi:hypothetical protein
MPNTKRPILFLVLFLLCTLNIFAGEKWYGMAKATSVGGPTNYAAFSIQQWRYDNGDPASTITLRFEPGVFHGFVEAESYVNRWVNVLFNLAGAIELYVQGVGQLELLPMPQAHYWGLPESNDISVSGYIPTRIEVGVSNPDYVFITILPREFVWPPVPE